MEDSSAPWVEVSRAVRGIRDIHVVSLTADRRDYDPTIVEQLYPRLRRACRNYDVMQDDILRVRPSFSLLGMTHPPDPAEPVEEDWVLRIEAQFAIEYHVKNLPSFKPEALVAFSQLNAVFNAWPYWRELVHSTIVRMGLPPLIVPVFQTGREAGKSASARTKRKASAKQLPSDSAKELPGSNSPEEDDLPF